MKKLTTLMLGLSLVLGTAAFAQETKPADKPAAEKKVKKTKKSKKSTAEKPAESTTK